MKDPTTAELQAMARDSFGRTITEAEAESYRPRLPVLVRNVAILREWEGRLREWEPAAVFGFMARRDGGADRV